MNDSEKNGDKLIVNVKTGAVTRTFLTPEEEQAGQEAATIHKQHEHGEKERKQKREQVISEASYENRIVIFLDILGWGALVDDSTTGPKILVKVLDNLKELTNYNSDDDNSDPFDTRVTHFSDSLVISLPERDAYPERIDFFLLGLISTTVNLELFIRGGITIGDIYHKEGFIFGPALNRAYKLESKKAKYPRILLDETIYRKWTDNQLNSSWTKLRDEYYFYDFIKKLSSSPYNAEHHLKPVKNAIENGLHKHSNDRNVFIKYHWLAKYFNKTAPNNTSRIECLSK